MLEMKSNLKTVDVVQSVVLQTKMLVNLYEDMDGRGSNSLSIGIVLAWLVLTSLPSAAHQ